MKVLKAAGIRSQFVVIVAGGPSGEDKEPSYLTLTS